MLWTVAHQAPLSTGFSRQAYWSGLPFPSPENLPHPGTELVSLSLLHWQVSYLPLVPPGKTQLLICSVIYLVSRRFPSSSIRGPLGHSLHWHPPTPPPLPNSHLETYRSPLFWVKCHSSYFQDTLVSFPDLRKFCLKKKKDLQWDKTVFIYQLYHFSRHFGKTSQSRRFG